MKDSGGSCAAGIPSSWPSFRTAAWRTPGQLPSSACAGVSTCEGAGAGVNSRRGGAGVNSRRGGA
eukprot:86875-Chlamydomonas_euryale.AAC.7